MAQPSSKIQTRNYTLRKEEKFAFKNTCVFSCLKVKRERNLLHLRLVVNGAPLEPSSKDKDSFTFDMKEIRNRIRDLDGCNEEEALQIAVEDSFVYNQLRVREWYKYLSSEDIRSSVFTSELAIQFELVVNGPVERLEVTETSFKSDRQLEIEEKKNAEK